MDIIQKLFTQVKSQPDKIAVIFKDKHITFRELAETSLKLSDSLIKFGIKKGDKVAINMPNCPEYIYSYIAIWTIGATAVPLDFMLTQEELSSCISHSESKALIAKAKPSISLEDVRKNAPALKTIILCGDEPGCLADVVLKGKSVVPSVKIKESDPAIIFYTSGTTGKPKGVLVNYRQLSAPPMAMEYFVHFSCRDVSLCALPFSHLGGLIYIQMNLTFGNTFVLMERFSPAEFLKNIHTHRVNWFWIVPSMYYAFLQLKEFETFDLSSLQWIVTFGASNSPEALRRFHKVCPNAHLLNGWGMTETNAPTVVLPLGSDNIESVGKPLPWVEVAVLDEKDRKVKPGTVGEIAVKGWVVTDGYYKDEELTRETLRNGWFHTGDLGKMDPGGDLYIVGRKKEMIKVAGEIVFEPEVEAALHRHPDVLEAAVVGVPDNMRGEVPKAFLVLKDGSQAQAEEIRQFCRQHLAHFKIPHYFEFVQSLPKNRSGKIDKESLKTKPQG